MTQQYCTMDFRLGLLLVLHSALRRFLPDFAAWRTSQVCACRSWIVANISWGRFVLGHACHCVVASKYMCGCDYLKLCGVSEGVLGEQAVHTAVCGGEQASWGSKPLYFSGKATVWVICFICKAARWATVVCLISEECIYLCVIAPVICSSDHVEVIIITSHSRPCISLLHSGASVSGSFSWALS